MPAANYLNFDFVESSGHSLGFTLRNSSYMKVIADTPYDYETIVANCSGELFTQEISNRYDIICTESNQSINTYNTNLKFKIFLHT